jgi:hypothetical protein
VDYELDWAKEKEKHQLREVNPFKSTCMIEFIDAKPQNRATVHTMSRTFTKVQNSFYGFPFKKQIWLGVREMDFLNNQNTYEAISKRYRCVCSVRSDPSLHKKEKDQHNCTKMDSAHITISVVT